MGPDQLTETREGSGLVVRDDAPRMRPRLATVRPVADRPDITHSTDLLVAVLGHAIKASRFACRDLATAVSSVRRRPA